MDNGVQIFFGIVLGVAGINPYAAAQIETAMVEGDREPNAIEYREAQGGTDGIQQAVDDRDPFWPVGYVPKPAAAEAEVEDDFDELGGHVDFSGLSKEERAVIKSKMVVGGILQQGNICLAIINNQLLKQGDGLSLKSGSKTYEFTVRRLTTEKILLESLQ